MKIKSLYIASLEKSAGSLIASMGVMEILKTKINKVAFFRPFVLDKSEDSDISFMLDYFKIQQQYDDTYGFTVQECEELIANSKEHFLIEEIIKKFKHLEREFDFVLIEGLASSFFTSTFEFDINIEVAKNLGSSIATVINGHDRETEDILSEIKIEAEAIKHEGCQHFATFANRLNEKSLKDLKIHAEEIAKTDAPIYLLPEVLELDTPTVREVQKALNAELLHGDDVELRRVVKKSKIAAMGVEHFLERLEGDTLIITPGDRADILVSAFSSIFSSEYPNIAGVLLTGGIPPASSVKKLIDGFRKTPLAVLTTEYDTYETAIRVKDVPAKITARSERKIALAMGLFNENVDVECLKSRIDTEASDTITPTMFEYSLFEKARNSKKRIVLPEATDERVLRASEILLRRGVVDIILLGDREKIHEKASLLGVDLQNAQIIDPHTSPLMEEFAEEFFQMRQGKGLLLPAARDAMVHGNYFATMMVQKNLADGMVSGAIHTTADTIRPALQIIKTKPGISVVSSIFFMCLDTKVLVFGDCAVNQNPDARQLAQIAISSAETTKSFGLDVKIAMLSYSTGTSGSGEDVEKVIEATNIVKKHRPDLEIEGPIQYDAAVEPSVAIKKLPNSKVAGQATILIFPDLNTGNNTYKAVQRSSGAIAIGPVLQGLKKPINDLSRGCLVADIVNTVAITAIQGDTQ